MVLGLDISTSKVGICVVYENSILCELTALDIDSKYFKNIEPQYRFIEKAKVFKDKITELKEKYDEIAKNKNNDEWKIRSIWVEAPLRNATKIDTVTVLYQFNGVCCYILSEVFGFAPKRVDENIARAKFLEEFVRVDTVRVENPEFQILKRKKKYKTPKNLNTPTKKYKYIIENFPNEEIPDPMVTIEKEIFNYPKDIVIKEYIFNKFKEIYMNTKIYDNLVWEYDRNGKLKDINYDKTDAWVIAEYGAKQI